MIENHYTKTINTYRMQGVSGPSDPKMDFIVLLSDIKCHIQPLDGADSGDINGSFGKDFLMLTDVCHDIQEQDQIYEGNKKYRVMSVEKFSFRKICRHQELRIRLFN